MTQEEKDLLLQDLCSRLPHGVKIQAINPDNEFVIEELSTISVFKSNFDCNLTELYEIKPYLFPLSSMTEEQKKEYASLCIKNASEYTDLYDIIFPKDYYDTIESIDYLYKNHIDIRGLIPMGLAVDATGLNIYK